MTSGSTGTTDHIHSLSNLIFVLFRDIYTIQIEPLTIFRGHCVKLQSYNFFKTVTLNL